MNACGWVLLTVALLVPVVVFGWLMWIGRLDKINPRVPYPPHEIMVSRNRPKQPAGRPNIIP